MRQRRGLTLLELVLAMVVTGILVGAMTSVLLVASRSLQVAAGGAGSPRVDAARLIEQITADLQMALVFNERTGNAVEFTVPDRDADDLPELVRYAWSGSPQYELTRLLHYSTDDLAPDPVVIATDVRQFDLEYLMRTWGPPPPPPALVSDELLLQWHDEIPDSGATRALLVIASAGSPSTQEDARRTLLESWGYSVSLIGASASQPAFDAAAAGVDVAYISEEINSFDLGEKLRRATIGVVNEEVNLVGDFGLASSFDFPTPSTSLSVDQPAHHVTASLGPGSTSMFSFPQAIASFDADPANQAPGLETLGTWSDVPSLAVIEAGAELYDPNGSDPPTVLLVVDDSTSPSLGESTRRTLLETWGYDVVLISADASQASFDALLAGADVTYVCAAIDADDLGTKLTPAPIGVVCEQLEMTEFLGLSNGPGGTEVARNITITDITHYITATLEAKGYDLCDNDQPLARYPGNLGAARVLATVGDRETLAVLETGDPLKGVGGTAAGRRVFMPWGGVDFDIDKLRDVGKTIMERAVYWALDPNQAGFGSVFANQTPLSFAQKHVATRVTFPTDARATSITAYLFQSDNLEMRFGIYADDGGEPGRLLGQTSKKKPDQATGWRTLDLTYPVDVLAGTYWLAMGLHEKAAYFYDGAGGQTRHADSGTDPKDGLMSTWDGTYESSARRVSIYAEYSEVELARGRRVELPWGGNAFDVGTLTEAGEDLTRRAVEWAADKEDPFAVVDVSDKHWPAQYIHPPLPENAVGWSITRIYVCVKAEDKIDGEVTFELRHASGDLKPADEVIVASPSIPESEFSPTHYRWYEVPIPPVEDLNPEYGVCLVVRGTKKQNLALKLDRDGAFATPGTHFTETENQGVAWSAPNGTDDLRFYVHGSYSTAGEPQWP